MFYLFRQEIMKKNILITWTSSWIWKYLKDNLEKENTIFEIFWKTEIDLRNKNEIEKYCNNILEKNIIFDTIILNAWVWEFWSFEENSLEKYEDIINLNLLANIRLLKLLEKSINKDTKIIFIWSIISKKSLPWASVYQASKFWLRWLALGLKSEWKKVFFINPKIVDTGFHKWKIELNKNFSKTSLGDIFFVINNIINSLETRFEIDL